MVLKKDVIVNLYTMKIKTKSLKVKSAQIFMFMKYTKKVLIAFVSQ